MIKIYHNPRCRKSRAGLDYLESKTSDFQIVKYLDNLLDFDQLKSLIKKTSKTPEELLRKQEDYYKKNLKGKTLSDDELIMEMVNNPKLIARPIIEIGDKAVLAEPPEEIEKIL
jgi:arsenate reductase